MRRGGGQTNGKAWDWTTEQEEGQHTPEKTEMYFDSSAPPPAPLFLPAYTLCVRKYKYRPPHPHGKSEALRRQNCQIVLELRNKTSLNPNFLLLFSSQNGPLSFPGSPGFGRSPAGRRDLEEVGPQSPEGLPAGAAQVIEKGEKRRAILGDSPFPFLAYVCMLSKCRVAASFFFGFLFCTHCWSSISRRNQVWLFL